MQLDRTIFRAYDIRGVYGKTIDEDVMRDIGRAVGTIMLRRVMGRELLIGNDIRASSLVLSEAFVEGVRSMGVNVTDVGTASFGAAIFAGWKGKFDITAYVTASHNPPEWNGVKFFDKSGVGFFEEVNIEVGRILIDNDFEKPAMAAGRLSKADAKPAYLGHVKSVFAFSKPLKAVVDCGNGSTSLVARAVFSMFPQIDADIIFDDVDPMFPARGADIEKENMQKLREHVVATGADIGVAFDGDGDRVNVVDDKGNIVTMDQLLTMIGEDMLKGTAGGHVIANVECSMLLEKLLAPMGAKVVRVPVGHTFMMQAAQKYDAVLGGESSYHCVIPSYMPFDDAMVAALKVMEVLSKRNERLSDIVARMPVFTKERININCPDGAKFQVLERLKEKFATSFGDGRLNTMDGVRVNMDDGWALIRCSNTSPMVRLTVEATDAAAFERIKSEFLGHLNGEIAKAV
ncbi:MAG: phosphomannomutase/phosphoglucomutase [Candidatus Aenigmarchaeota archaeon]|nr:phosphomannomutase/phosphoglucomutase [Candidatus Aenigmarchaeota archaeon]